MNTNNLDNLTEEEVKEWCEKRHYTIITSDLYLNCLRSGNAVMVNPDETLVISGPCTDYLSNLINQYKKQSKINKPIIVVNSDPEARLYVVKKNDLKVVEE